MPIPKPSVSPGPRTLLRDVAYEQMRAAIESGTLEPGERLNDDELTTWLGVSRTPVREAIARLAADGLVDMAANRYTRVAEQSAAAHDEAAAVLSALHAWAIDHTATASPHTRRDAARLAQSAHPGINDRHLEGYRDLHDAAGTLIAGLGNELLAATELTIRSRVRFHAAAEGAAIDWDRASELARRLAAE
ncbi:GntR family transcriptional regulator [Curtobacterium sp. VKM Ac-1393]|uniref:GntR family transcriptional regulator n=1 Tax=Curtobacterium sp. VKM Ac-1393 TaxID=2783814 RepID=UPI00188B4C63|nr:GntR family transcriptional regulator [Curtobacterium sp. VKM Ac-1393]MBF4607303.1 GntR family transcriptional regulator [Curtobacterium sp. VKM Ac-1393]